jgi:hypothetical protein
MVPVVALAGLVGSGCSDDGPGTKPADLSLTADVGTDCVELTKGGSSLGSWCGTNITSFDVERTYTDPDSRFVVLLIVDGELQPSKDYVVWEAAGRFLLVGTSDAGGLTFSVESDGKVLPCGGGEKVLDCVPLP